MSEEMNEDERREFLEELKRDFLSKRRKLSNAKYYSKKKETQNKATTSGQNNFLDTISPVGDEFFSSDHVPGKSFLSDQNLDIAHTDNIVESDDLESHVSLNSSNLNSQVGSEPSLDGSLLSETLITSDRDFIYPNSDISLKELALSLAILKYKHKFSDSALDDILNLIKILTPTPNNVPKTFKTLANLLYNNVYATQYQVCLNCNNVIEYSKDNICIKCTSSESAKFSIFDIKPQLEYILSNEKNLKQIKQANDKRKQIKSASGQIANALDGSLYSNIEASDEIIVSFNLNTDGAPLLKSKNFSLWPVLATIVELDQPTREKFDNIIVLGIWLHSSKPMINTYLF